MVSMLVYIDFASAVKSLSLNGVDPDFLEFIA